MTFIIHDLNFFTFLPFLHYVFSFPCEICHLQHTFFFAGQPHMLAKFLICGILLLAGQLHVLVKFVICGILLFTLFFEFLLIQFIISHGRLLFPSSVWRVDTIKLTTSSFSANANTILRTSNFDTSDNLKLTFVQIVHVNCSAIWFNVGRWILQPLALRVGQYRHAK